jgi:hypothetical protein
MGTMKRVLYRQLFVIYIFPLRLCHCPKGNLLIQVWLYTGDLLIQVWLALARRPGLPFLTAGLPNFVTRKARQTSAYKIYPPINFTYIDEMMTFLRKSKFPMINIATIITITNQNCFLLWSDVFFFGTIHCLGQGISVLINCSIPSLVSDNLISYSPRAHVWGWFCWRSRLVKLDFAFSLVKNEMHVAL